MTIFSKGELDGDLKPRITIRYTGALIDWTATAADAVISILEAGERGLERAASPEWLAVIAQLRDGRLDVMHFDFSNGEPPRWFIRGDCKIVSVER